MVDSYIKLTFVTIDAFPFERIFIYDWDEEMLGEVLLLLMLIMLFRN